MIPRCCLFFVLLLGLSPKLAAQGTAPHPADLDHRRGLAMSRLTSLEEIPAFTLDFILSDVRLDRTDPRRFYNFSGDLSGRYLEVMSVAMREGLLTSERLPNGFTVSELADSILAQQQGDGRFGDPALRFTAAEIGGEHMALLWGNGRLLVGLMAYYETSKDPDALLAARRLGDFFITTAEASREPAVVKRLEGFGAKGIICFTQYIEGLVMLARATGDLRYREAAVDAYQVLPARGIQHTHGYLSTLRGVVDLYALTQDARHLAYAQRLFDDLLTSEDYTVFGAVKEYFGAAGERDEGCSSADFVRLALQLYRATGEARYREAAVYAIPNALLYNQFANGDFGAHAIEEGHLAPSKPMRAWWCCTMHGLLALLAIESDAVLADGDGAAELSLLLPMSFQGEGFAGRLLETVDVNGRFVYSLSLKQVGAGPFRVRLPAVGQYSDWRLEGEGMSLDTVRHAVSIAAPTRSTTYRFRARPNVRIVSTPTLAAVVPDGAQPSHGALLLGHYLLGTRTDAYIAEPDHANQVDYSTLTPLPGEIGVEGMFREGGFPGRYGVRFGPVAAQGFHGHGYLRFRTRYAVGPEFRAVEE